MCYTIRTNIANGRSEEYSLFNYTGYECKSCGKKFTDDDDIVVCPECGTPYHRDCYKKEGRCINDELHSKHMSWKAEIEEKEEAEGLKCTVCGNSLRPDQLFCDKCGTPTPYYLSQQDAADSSEQESFSDNGGAFGNAGQSAMETMYPYMINYSDPLCGFSPDEKYDEDMTTKDIADFVGSNTRYYLPKFKVMKTTRFKLSFNIPAMLFPEFYFAYRKMPLLAFLVLLIKSIISLPSSLVGMKLMLTEYGFQDVILNMYPALEAALTKVAEFNVSSGSFNMLYNISSLVSWVIIFIFATLSNYFYYKNVISKGSKVKKEAAARGANTSEALKSAGGVSAALLVTFIVLYFLSTYAVMAAILLIV